MKRTSIRIGHAAVWLAPLLALAPACGPTGTRAGVHGSQPAGTRRSADAALEGPAAPVPQDPAPGTAPDAAAGPGRPLFVDAANQVPPAPESARGGPFSDARTPVDSRAPDAVRPDNRLVDAEERSRDVAADKPADVSPPGVDLSSGLVALWKMDEGNASAVAADSSGNGNAGTLKGMNLDTDWVDGPSGKGKALSFNGTSYVLVPTSNSLNGITAGVTVAAWVYRTQNKNGFSNVASRQLGVSGSEHYGLSFYDDRLCFLGDTFGQLYNGVSSPTNQWMHVAGTFDGTNVRIYVDGVQVAAMVHVATLNGDSSSLIIGGNQNDATGVVTETFVGRIDDLRLYSRALGAAEVAALAK